MSNKNDGGPVYPRVDGTGNYFPGISLRDYCAVHANEEDIMHIIHNTTGTITRQQARYLHADAMLKARDAD